MSSENLTPDQKLVKEYCQKFEACQRARKRYEQEWYTNLAFYFGKHYIQWTKSTTGLSTNLIIPKAPAWRVRHVINRLKPVIRKEIAKLNKERPVFDVIPQTPDDEDIAKARMAKAIAEFFLNSAELHQSKRQAIFWQTICGIGYTKTHMKNADDVEFLAPTPYHIWVPNLEEPLIQRQPFVVHGVTHSPGYIKERFDVDLQPDETSENSMSKFLTSVGVDRKPDDIGEIFCKEFWVKPNSDFPDGAFFIIAQDKLLYIEEGIPEIEKDPETGEDVIDPETEKPILKKSLPSNILGGGPTRSRFPYSHGRYPFQKFDHIPTGRYYSESVLVDLIPLQKEYNRSRSQVTEARNLTAKPQYVTPRGSIDVTKLVAKPGNVVEYTPGFDKPSILEMPELPAFVFQDQDRTVSDMDYISNQHEVTQGRTPPGVEAASAIAYLQEENDSILGPSVDSIEECMEDIGYQAIELAREFWPDDKMLKIISGNQVYEVLQFKRGSLPEEVDFRIERGSMQPRSIAAQRAFIMELVNSGAIPPIEGLKYLEMSMAGRLYEDLQVDVRQVERENFKMKNGLPVEINEFDNDEIHAITHAKFMKSQTYETLDPTIKEQILAHYMGHMNRLGRVQLNAGADPNSGNGSPESGSGEPATA